MAKNSKVSHEKNCDISKGLTSISLPPNYKVFDRLMLYKETMDLEILKRGFIHLFYISENKEI